MVRFSLFWALVGVSLGGCLVSEPDIREAFDSHDMDAPDTDAPDMDAANDEGACVWEESASRFTLPATHGFSPMSHPAIQGDGSGNWGVWTASALPGDGGVEFIRLRYYNLEANTQDTRPVSVCGYFPGRWQICGDPDRGVFLGRTTVNDTPAHRFMLTPPDGELRGMEVPGMSMHFLEGPPDATGTRILYTHESSTRMASAENPGELYQTIDLSSALSLPGAVFRHLAAGRTESGVCIAGLEENTRALRAVFVPDVADPRATVSPTRAEIPEDACDLASMAQTATGWIMMCHHRTEAAIAVYHAPRDCRIWTRVTHDPRLEVGERMQYTPTSLVPGPDGGLVGAWGTETEVAVAQFDADGAIRAIEMLTPTPGQDGQQTEPQAVSLAVDGANYLVAYTLEDGSPPEFRALTCGP